MSAQVLKFGCIGAADRFTFFNIWVLVHSEQHSLSIRKCTLCTSWGSRNQEKRFLWRPPTPTVISTKLIN